MGVRFRCPNGHTLNVKAFLAGKRGICPECGQKVQIPHESDPAVVAEKAARKAARRARKTDGSRQDAPAKGTGNWYVRPPSGGQFGPASSEVFSTWVTEGRITPDSYVWREGWTDWHTAAKVLEDLDRAAPELPEVPSATSQPADPRKAATRPGTATKVAPGVATAPADQTHPASNPPSADESRDAKTKQVKAKPPQSARRAPASVESKSVASKPVMPKSSRGQPPEAESSPVPAALAESAPQIKTFTPSAASDRQYRRRKSNKTVTAVIAFLALACVLLFIALVYVVR